MKLWRKIYQDAIKHKHKINSIYKGLRIIILVKPQTNM